MVGVPRSTGCQLCRRRKVKCDEARPACGNCLKYGAACPGYHRDAKFVTGKHLIRQRGKKEKHNNTETTPQQLTPPQTPPLGEALAPLRGHVVREMMERFCPSAPPDMLGVFRLVDAQARLGRDALLDGAVCSLALHLAGKEAGDEALVARSRTVYGRSLSELQAALRHASRWSMSETLFAAILLCYFELFAGTSSPDTWLQHAKGIGVLMERRGPAAHAEGWDAAMLLSFRGILIMSDMFFPREQACFLARPEWRPAMRDAGRCLVHPAGTPPESVRVVDGYFQRLVDVPAVLRGGYLVRAAHRAGLPVDPTSLEVLAAVAGSAYESFSAWYRDEFCALPYVQTYEVPPGSKAASEVYPSALRHEHPWAGAMHMSTWASLLILQETLSQCGRPVDGSEAKRDQLVRDILRSVESVGSGTMGPYRVGYALRIAYEFASVEEQAWVGGVLDVFSRRYAATDRRTYPEPGEES